MMEENFDLSNSHFDSGASSRGYEENHNQVGPIECNEPAKGKKSKYKRAYIADPNVQAYLNEIGAYPLLAKENFTELLKQYQENGDEDALHELILGNLKLTTIVGSHYNNQTSFTYLDVLQICNLEMCKPNNPFTKYDPEEGPLVDYILYSMRNAVGRALRYTGGPVKIPQWLHDKILKARNTNRELRYSLGRKPTFTELADAMNIAPDKLKEYFSLHSLSVCSLDDEIYSSPDSRGVKNITVESRIATTTPRPDFHVKAMEALELCFKDLQEFLMTIADTVPKVFSNSGRKRKEQPRALQRTYKKNLSPGTLLKIERNMYIVRVKFGFEDSSLEPHGDTRTAEIVSEKYSTINRQLVRNALDSIWASLPEKYSDRTEDWLIQELEKLDLLIELTNVDREHLIYLLRRGNKLF